MFNVFLKLAAVAKPVIRHYAADFYCHDANLFAKMRPGDVALWAPRESGSCVIIVARARVANERARESLLAFQSSFNNLDWHEIDTDVNGEWDAQPCADPMALIAGYLAGTADSNRDRIRNGEPPIIVSEFHM